MDGLEEKEDGRFYNKEVPEAGSKNRTLAATHR
jgi:hypothetical protein